MEQRGSAVSRGGAEIAYRVFGSGERALVAVHGWMTSGAVFDALAVSLEGSGWRIVVPDLAGTGRSSRPASGYRLERFAADVHAVIDHLGLERPAILGHSMGGQVAQLVAAARPVDRLALVTPVPLGGASLPDDARALFATAAGDAAKLGTILSLASPELSDDDRARLVARALEVAEACLVESLEAWLAGAPLDALARIDAPTLVVATDDPFLPRALLEAEVAGRIAGAELIHLAGLGHYPIVSAPARTAAVVRAFLT